MSSNRKTFSSGDIKPREIFDPTLNTQRTFKYFDKHHPANKGEIIVR
ncbi:MAG TPA: hypothetical protein VIY08_05445 [Candidatus Nitrosocosmicus sp.]